MLSLHLATCKNLEPLVVYFLFASESNVLFSESGLMQMFSTNTYMIRLGYKVTLSNFVKQLIYLKPSHYVS